MSIYIIEDEYNLSVIVAYSDEEAKQAYYGEDNRISLEKFFEITTKYELKDFDREAKILARI